MLTELKELIPGLPDRYSPRSPGEGLLEERLSWQRGGVLAQVDISSSDRTIYSMLNCSLLPTQDKAYVRDILEINSQDPELRKSVRYILEAAETIRTRRKMRERQNPRGVSLEDVLAPFSSREKRLIVTSLAGVQLTDGCTVGCAWCGFEAKRRVTKAFDLESLKHFSGSYGRGMKHGFLYFASDPFDWVDGEYTFTDVHSVWSKNTRSFSYVSTAVPEGAEFSVIRFIETTFQLDELNRLDNLAFPSLAQQIRLSRTDRNAARIEHMLNILRIRGVSENFIRKIFVLDLSEAVQAIGYFIGQAGQGVLNVKDNIGIMCMDGVVISPDKGVRAMTMEVPTKKSPMGIREWAITPGDMTVPGLCYRERYSGALWTVRGKLVPFALLPPVELLHIRNGRIIAEETIQSVGRDALTFALISQDLRELTSLLLEEREGFLKSFSNGAEDVAVQVTALREEFVKRKVDCLAGDCDDQEAVEIARVYIGQAEELFNDLTRELKS